MEERVEGGRLRGRQIPPVEGREPIDREAPRGGPNPGGLHCREKLLTRADAPVPETDTGRRGEDPKVRGKTLVKELGKMYP